MPYDYQHQGGMWGNRSELWVRGIMFLFCLIALAAIVVVVVNVLGRHSGSSISHVHGLPQSSGESSHALHLLDERFARGEIDAEEFTKRRDILRAPQ